VRPWWTVYGPYCCSHIWVERRGATTSSELGRSNSLFYRKKLDRSTQFGAVGYIIAFYSSKTYVRSCGGPSKFWGPDPRPPMVAPMVERRTSITIQWSVWSACHVADRSLAAVTCSLYDSLLRSRCSRPSAALNQPFNTRQTKYEIRFLSFFRPDSSQAAQRRCSGCNRSSTALTMR